jgi:hypothetical protein
MWLGWKKNEDYRCWPAALDLPEHSVSARQKPPGPQPIPKYSRSVSLKNSQGI